MMNEKYGYIFARSGPEEEEFRDILRQLSVPEENIYVDPADGKKPQQPFLEALIRKLRKEDLIYIRNLSHLGNTYREILSRWKAITGDRGADVSIFDSPVLNTTNGKEFKNPLLCDIVSETLFFVCENEHEKNRRRQSEGYLAAKKRGVRFGRPASPLPENFMDVYRRWKAGELTGTRAAEECGMPLSTFRYRARLLEEG